ncbi:MAG: ion transporter [Chloroflexia bacterium]|nr:ion transporter [Chloroflexia bacterium]
MRLKNYLNQIIFESDTKAGKWFDIALLCLIVFSVLLVITESVPEIGLKYSSFFLITELILTIIFTIEYIVRIAVSERPKKYILSFWGIIDLLSVLPTYLSIIFSGYHYLLVVRIFRLLRIFRILRLARFNRESAIIIEALKASYYKISIFLLAVFFLTILLGTLMYVVEGGEQGFTSIPQSIYWAIVTITTVGYGDLVPATAFGKFLSSFIMLLGYAIIAVPTGIVTVELSKKTNDSECGHCKHKNPLKSNFCNNCGHQLTHIQ